MQIKVYSSDRSHRGFSIVLKEMVSDLMLSRELAWRLAVRDTKALYRQSVLGILWAFITPLMNTLVWIFMNNTGVINVTDAGIPYSLYVFSGTMLWSVLLESISAPLQQTQAAQSIMTKINFPREALILSGIYKILLNTAIKVILVIAVMLFMGISPNANIAFVPLALISLILFGTVIGMLITPVGMLYTDIGKGLPLITQFLMYFSPVVYIAPKAGVLSKIVAWNPITPLIDIARQLITGLPISNLQYFVIINLAVIVSLFFAWLLFRISIPIIVERMTS